MTDSDWFTCTDPAAMLTFLRGRGARDRKLRLFACACYHRLSDLFSSTASDRGIWVAEQFADGQAAASELVEAADHIATALNEFELNLGNMELRAALVFASKATQPDAWRAARGILVNATFEVANAAFRRAGNSDAAHHRAERNEKAAQARQVREIFSNPFRPIIFAPEWRTSTVVALARGIYEERAFDRLPLLIDALMDAGCNDEDVLAHCRQATGHHRGCWVVDLVLNKG